MQWNITDYQEMAGQTGYATVCCSVGQIVRLWHATKAFSLSVIWSELNFPAMMPYMRSLDHFQNRPWHKSSLLVWEKLLIWTPKSPQVGEEDDNLIWSRSKILEILYLYETCLNMYVVCLGGCWWVHMICTYDIYVHMCEHVYICAYVCIHVLCTMDVVESFGNLATWPGRQWRWTSLCSWSQLVVFSFRWAGDWYKLFGTVHCSGDPCSLHP